MKNLIRGHLFYLKKDHLFFGCLALSLIMLIISIRLSYFTSDIIPTTGTESFINTFLGSDIILYAFMLLTANMVGEIYQSGVFKNIIGKGISKKKYYLSVILTVSIIYLFVMLISSIIVAALATNKFGMGTISHPIYYVLAIITRILFVMTYISFSLTAIIFTKKAITGIIIALIIPNIPQILEAILDFLKMNVSLDFIKISSHMSMIQSASTDLSAFLPCFIILIIYLGLSTIIGINLLKYQDIK